MDKLSSGDMGKTTLCGKTLIKKDCHTIDCLGIIDETNCFIGLAKNYIKPKDKELIKSLQQIQNNLILIGSIIAKLEKDIKLKPHVNALIKQIKSLENKIKIPRKFSVPGRNKVQAHLHIVRSKIRASERRICSIQGLAHTKQYINKLSWYIYLIIIDMG